MATIKVYHEVTIDNVTLTGDRLSPITLSDVTKLAYCVQDVAVAVSSTSLILWTTGSAGITTFTRGLIVSDQDLYVELRTDNASAEFAIVKVEANQPTWLGAVSGGSTTEALDGATLVDGTDFDDVDRIEVQNEGTTAATVSLFLFT
jgi:hypothetical protein